MRRAALSELDDTETDPCVRIMEDRSGCGFMNPSDHGPKFLASEDETYVFLARRILLTIEFFSDLYLCRMSSNLEHYKVFLI